MPSSAPASTCASIHTRHEQGAAYMALGAALATGKPQAYAVVPGPGLLNSGAALLTAYGMNAPVLALIGQIPAAAIGRGFGHLHEIRDQAGIIARLVDHSARIDGPAEAPHKVAKAIRVHGQRPAGPGRARMRHRCLGQARAGRADRAARAGARAAHRRGRGARGGEAARQSQARADRRRRRRAGCLARSDAALRACCRRPCWPTGAAAACSTAAIRSASRCRSAASCGRRPTPCWRSARGCSSR